MKDRELTRLLQAHPEEGLEAAMLEYAPLVKGILCRILPQNPCDREECMADVFVALWRSAAKLEAARTPLRPWLAVAARNRGIDCYNALHRRETVTLDDGLAETLGFAHITQLTCAEHDKMIGYVSQLTHAIAVSLMNANDNTHLAEYTGDSFRDLTRIAKINENLWSELFFLNKENLIAEIDQFSASLEGLKRALVENDETELKRLFVQSTARRRLFDKKREAR